MDTNREIIFRLFGTNDAYNQLIEALDIAWLHLEARKDDPELFAAVSMWLDELQGPEEE